MATDLETLRLRFQSEAAAALSKDVAASERVDAALRRNQESVDKLRATHAKNAAAARAAEDAERKASLALASGNHSGADSAKLVADLKRKQAEAARAAAREEASAAALSKAHRENKDLQDARPELVALARKKSALLEEAAAAKRAAAEEKAAAKAAERDKVAAAKRVASEDKAAARIVARDKKNEEREAKRLAKEREDAAKKFAKDRKESSERNDEKRVAAQQAAMLGAAGAAGALALSLGVAYGALVKFGFGAAGAARDARILGEALTGSASLGAEYTTVIDQLAGKVPLAKERIAELAREMSLMKLGRRDLQAGLAATAVVTSALGDSAGSAIKSIVAASASSRRFMLGTRDLYGELTGLAGTGLKKADVLAALSTQLKRSIPEVERMLLQGRIKMADGMRALEAAAKGRFGKTISEQMLSFDTQLDKAKERLGGMFRDVNINPALRGLESFLSILDESTVTGQGMKALLTAGFGDISKGIGVAGPLAKTFFQGAIIGALQTYLALRPIGRKIQEWIGPMNGVSIAFTAGKYAVFALAAAFGLAAVAAAAALSLIVLPFAVLGAVIYGAVKGVQAAWDWLTGSAADAASNLITGFVGWIKSGGQRAVDAVSGLAADIAGAFKSKLGIASPSRLFASYGRFTVQGYTQGVERDTPRAQDAVANLGDASPAAPGPRRLGSASSSGIQVNLVVERLIVGGREVGGAEKQGIVGGLLEAIEMALGAATAGKPAMVT